MGTLTFPIALAAALTLPGRADMPHTGRRTATGAGIGATGSALVGAGVGALGGSL